MSKRLSKTKADAVLSFVREVKQCCPRIDSQYDLDRLADDFINKSILIVDDYDVHSCEDESSDNEKTTKVVIKIPLFSRIWGFFFR